MPDELAVIPKRAMARLVGGLAAVMIVPPVVAGIFGSLALAVVVGVVSILVGLVSMNVVVSRWEIDLRRPARPELPVARVIDRELRR